jgi:hypothetical protein
MKIKCDCGCTINQPVTSRMNGYVRIICFNCKKDYVIILTDNDGLEKVAKVLANNNQ